jgi:hypothetical protein
MAENGVPGWLINKTRCADARVPVVVSEMMKSALRKCTARFAIRLECDGNIEPNTRRLAPAASDDSSSRTRWRSATRYFAGNTTSAPLFFSKNTRNFAELVLLAFRPTVCTSLGPS